MERNYIIDDTLKNYELSKPIFEGSYLPLQDMSTPIEQTNYTPSLPEDKDIFKDLSNNIYRKENVKKFLTYLRNAIAHNYDCNISLSKLYLTCDTDEETVIEWVFSNFRIFISFNSNSEDFYGVTISNSEDGYMMGSTFSFKEEDYERVANKIFEIVVKNVNYTNDRYKNYEIK